MFVERAAQGSVRGDHWRVSWYDRELGKFVGGAGPNAWRALAWALVNRVETARDMIVIARNTSDTPAIVLARLEACTEATAAFSRAVELPKNLIITPSVESAATRRSKTKRKKTV